jgi:pyridoxamine 5'-phosphate oxidase
MPLPTELLPDPLPEEPFALACAWLEEARRLARQPNPDSMVLATVGRDGRPSARVLLCKEIAPQPGQITFYTNYLSRKGRELAANARAAAVLHWDHLHRQVRIEGVVGKVSAADSDAYFASRPWQRRIGAWASAQSEAVGSRQELLTAVRAAAAHFRVPVPGPEADGPDPGVPIPRPPHWGGYRLLADAVELWVEGESRIHDRARWTRLLEGNADAARPGPWTVRRLQP